MLASLKESDQEEPYPISFYNTIKDKNDNKKRFSFTIHFYID